jgi:hypothetical protein
MRKVQRAASSPAARKKAVETFKRRRAEKAELEAKMQAQAAEGALAHVPDGGHHMSIDDIPDGPVRKVRGKNKPKAHVKYDMGRVVTEDEWLFLQMAKRLLRGMK